MLFIDLNEVEIMLMRCSIAPIHNFCPADINVAIYVCRDVQPENWIQDRSIQGESKP